MTDPKRARIFLSPPHMGDLERKLLLEAFDSNWIAPLGPHVDAFEREFESRLGEGHAVALSSGTGALHLALLLLGVQRGDVVFCSSLTFAATANAITYLGAEPFFIDSERISWNMDPDLLEEALDNCAKKNRLPKAVVVVDIYGQCADYRRIREICGRYEVPILEDAAEALGADYRGSPAGTLGDIGVYSFNGNKIITTSGGGMLLTRRADHAEKARFLATQARDPAPHYEHSVIGYNYRMSNLLAAVGRGQLAVLDQRVDRRRYNNRKYREAFAGHAGIDFMPEAAYGRANCWLTCITLDPASFGADRERIRRHLAALDIEARPVWKPMHLQPAFAACSYRGNGVSDDLFARGLCLPSGTAMTDEDLSYVASAVLEVAFQ